jgi:hypothetical protein
MSKNSKILISVSLIILVLTLAQNALAVSATLYGEVTDDGGDPYLYVWFQYGTTTSYGNQTPMQTKYGTGEFSATITGLAMCTTYHYRAVSRHQAYDDTKYGQDKTFTTECPLTVDLKVNGSDGPISLSYTNRTINLSWSSINAHSCNAEILNKPSGSNVYWSGSKALSGNESITLDIAGTYTFKLTCTNNTTNSSNYDTVQVNLGAPTLAVITKGVVITY